MKKKRFSHISWISLRETKAYYNKLIPPIKQNRIHLCFRLTPRENDNFCETTYIRHLASSEMACIDRLVVLA